jgi:hypothetical protein
LSRNRSRTGVEKTTKDADPPLNQLAGEQNNSFSFVIPTEFVDLPSEGRLYPEGHPLCGTAHIEIKQMTAKEEDILTSRSLLKKGIAIDRLIRNVIVNKAIDPGSLLIGDRNALIVACRVSGYGNLYKTKVNCPSCAESQQYEFDLNLASMKAPVSAEKEDGETFDVTENENGTFEITLPQTKLVIGLGLLTGHDERRISSLMESDRKKKTDRIVTRQLANIIISVNGNETTEAVNYVSNNLPSGDSKYVREAYKFIAPNLDLSQYFACETCGHEQDMEVPLNAEFFWPNA